LQSIYPLGAIFVLIVVFMPEGLAGVGGAREARALMRIADGPPGR
jgi:hypothetical protein